MKKLCQLSLLAVLTSVIISCSSTDNNESQSILASIGKNIPPNTLSKKEQKKGWQLLFDGTTTTGWHGFNLKAFPDCWTIEDGSLTMNTTGSQESQDIITDKSYRNFAISLEYKMTKACNSGIIFQVAEDTIYKFPYETGPEMQIIDADNWEGKLEEWQVQGANYAMYTPLAKPYKPVGEWNQLLIVVKGNDVTQFLNGVMVVHYIKGSEEWTKLRNSGKWSAFPDWGKYDEGHISLQNHGTKVWFRSIKLKEI